MKKFWILTVLCITLVGVLVGCGGKDTITPNQEDTFAIQEVKEAIDDYFRIFGSLKSSPYTMLEEIGLTVNVDRSYENQNNLTKFNDTKIKFTDFKDKILNYISEEQFKSKFENTYSEDDNTIYSNLKNVDGMLYVKETSSNGLATKVVDVSKIDDNKYTANVIIVDPEAIVDKAIEDYINTNNEHIYEFTIASYNGKCVIDTCEW